MKLKKLTQILKFSLHILKKIMSLICQVLIQLFDGNIHTYSRNLTDFEAFCEWNCEWIIFPLIVLKYLWMEIWSFIVLLWDSYSQVLWNSDWMQVQSMGTHCQVSSQLIKKISYFFYIVSSACCQIRTRDLGGSLVFESSALPIRYRAVDKDVTFIVLYICQFGLKEVKNAAKNIEKMRQ